MRKFLKNKRLPVWEEWLIYAGADGGYSIVLKQTEVNTRGTSDAQFSHRGRKRTFEPIGK